MCPLRLVRAFIKTLAIPIALGAWLAAAPSFGASVIATSADPADGWRVIAPVGNLQGLPLDTVGLAWEAAHGGWNTSLAFDDSSAAGWHFPVARDLSGYGGVSTNNIWADDAGNTPMYLRKVFTLASDPISAQIGSPIPRDFSNLVDDDVQIYLNGTLVYDDRDASATLIPATDVSAYLHAGTNLLAAKAHDSVGINEHFSLTIRIHTDPETPDCSNGFDDDQDARADYPLDPECLSASGMSESQCGDGIDNDADGFVDFPDDPDCAAAYDDTERPQCSDGLDNDGDGLVDFPADPGCAAASSDTENPECSDGLDNDGDGQVDYPDDTECLSASGASESQCNDGIDNDGDGLVDFPDDPGCADANGDRENPECNDGLDNDGDGFADYPNDPDCPAASGVGEAQCNDGIDNDGDGWLDAEDLDCAGPHDPSELTECRDGIDNDGDGLVDFPDDPGCPFPDARRENPQCDDGIDNDGDGFVDAADPVCQSHWPYWESVPHCGLGAELALVVPPLLWLRRRARSSS